jgi:hypothetical protein
MAGTPAPIVAQAQINRAGETAARVRLDPAAPEVAIVDVEPADDAPFSPQRMSKVALKRTAVALLADLAEAKWVAANQ